MNRRAFVRGTGLLAASPFFSRPGRAAAPGFPVVRPAVGQRRFRSRAVEAALTEFGRQVPDAELSWLLGNCLPNALDTTVTPGTRGGRPDTYVGTRGATDAMGLRESAAQVWPYLAFVKQDAPLRQLVAGIINRHTRCILLDPYANAFYNDPAQVGAGPPDRPAPPPGVHERKWAIDSLCYPIRLAYHYWKTTGDEQPFDAQWRQAIALTVSTFREQQRKTGPGPYRFQRATANAADTQPLGGAGYPVRPVGLIASAFRPSGEATRLPFLVPSNFFAVASLRQAALMLNDIHHDGAAYQDLMALADEVAVALRTHAIVTHPVHGRVYTYEVDGYGGHALLDEASVPSLLALPYLGAIPLNDPVYQNTRRLVLSADNPFFYRGQAAEGIGSPRTGPGLIWPLSVIMRGLTSTNEAEIRACVQMLKTTHAGTGYPPESFHQDDPRQYTRAGSAEANSLLGEFLWKVYQERPALLG
ncbi:glycoside hydrolase family 125 protein [Hymenobacter bucti]|uniref:Glycoside hydrolase family 125 protein n=1 Tax=Hymenobacter bucti TaxID=1844114 RepID=A0ABW4QV24_9BACT